MALRLIALHFLLVMNSRNSILEMACVLEIISSSLSFCKWKYSNSERFYHFHKTMLEINVWTCVQTPVGFKQAILAFYVIMVSFHQRKEVRTVVKFYIPAVPLSSCVTLDKSFSRFTLDFLCEKKKGLKTHWLYSFLLNWLNKSSL